MMKRFLEWIKIKEFLHFKKQSPSFDEREVWWTNIGENIGHEENGKDIRFVRSFVVIKKFNKDLLFGVPCSSVLKESKYYFKISVETVDFETVALLSQGRTISSKRLVRRIDLINKDSFEELKMAFGKAIFK